MENKPLTSRTTGAFYNTWGLAFVLIFIFLFQTIFYFVAVYASALIFGTSFHDAMNLLIEPDGTATAINMARFTNVVAFVGQMFFPALLFTVINRSSMKMEGGLGTPIKLPLIFLAILILALAIPLVDYFTAMFQDSNLPQSIKYYANYLENSREVQVNTIMDMHRPSELLFCLTALALLPALLEELIFRGILLRIFNNIIGNTWTPIVLQALVFAVLHFSIFQFPAIFFMGLLFGYIAQKTGTITYGIIMHFLFNSVTVVLYYLNSQEFDKTGVFGKYSTIPLNPLLAIASVAGLVILLRLFRNVQNKYLAEANE